MRIKIDRFFFFNYSWLFAATFIFWSSWSNAQNNGSVAEPELILKVSDYGAVGDGKTDDGPALRKVFEKVSSLKKPAKIVFAPKSIYYIGKRSDSKTPILFLDRTQNITIEGNGCLLLLDPTQRPFELYRSANVTIRNFIIDYFPLPYTQGRIKKIDNPNGYLEFEVDRGFPQPFVRDSTYYVDGRVSDCTTIDGETLKFYHGHSRISQVKEVSPGVYAVNYRMPRQTKAKPGDYFVMKIWPPSRPGINVDRDTAVPSEKGEIYAANYANIQINHSNSILVENITSYAAPQMTVNARSTSGLVIRNLNIKRKGNRLVAGCSDGIHLKGNESQPLIDGGWIEGTLDDAIHIKISGDRITEVAAPNKFKIVHLDFGDNTNLNTGKKVMVFNLTENKQLAMATIKDFKHIDYRTGWVTLDQDVAGVQTGDALYLQAEGVAVIQNTRFETQLQRAILTHQPTIIRKCTIVDNGMGLDQALMSGGIEGPPPQKLIFDSVAFVNLTNVALNVNCPSKNYDQLGTPQIIVKNCLFNLPNKVPVLRISNSNGASFTNNIFCYPDRVPTKEECFLLSNTPMSEFTGNSFRKGWVPWDGWLGSLKPEGDIKK